MGFISKILFLKIFRVESFCLSARKRLRQANLAALKPPQQRLVMGAIKGAVQKKLNCSFAANSANASAIPSCVSPS